MAADAARMVVVKDKANVSSEAEDFFNVSQNDESFLESAHVVDEDSNEIWPDGFWADQRARRLGLWVARRIIMKRLDDAHHRGRAPARVPTLDECSVIPSFVKITFYKYTFDHLSTNAKYLLFKVDEKNYLIRSLA